MELILPVEKAGGHVIAVSADGGQRVRLTVDGPSTSLEYSTLGRVSSRRIRADFGTLGQVDVKVRFTRYGRGLPRMGRCAGRAPVEGEGTYRGKIELSRDGGDIPGVSVRGGRAYFERTFRQVCKRRHPEPKPGDERKRETEEGVLTVSGKGEGRTVRFEVLIFALRRNLARSGGIAHAAVYERRDEVRIARSAGTLFGHGSFVMSERGVSPETVEARPPGPFAGQALYSRSPNAPASWVGDLRVDLPGAEQIPLAGPGLSAFLCRGSVDSCS